MNIGTYNFKHVCIKHLLMISALCKMARDMARDYSAHGPHTHNLMFSLLEIMTMVLQPLLGLCHRHLNGRNFGPHKIDIRVVRRSKDAIRVLGM